ncbi:MAG: FAD-dependent oxidoreductase [Tumebacillaceae bacterium]
MKQHAVIIGGSIAGLTCALALKSLGFKVTIVEGDQSPDPSITPQTSDVWARRGAPHARQPHVLTARLRNALRSWYPDLVQEFLDGGIWEQRFEETIHPKLLVAYKPLAEDEAITVLMARRTTLELVMRRHVERHSDIEFLAGKRVDCLVLQEGTPPRVEGVQIGTGNGARILFADVTIDASGRNSRFADQLRDQGIDVKDEHHVSNTAYYARHYRLLPGQTFPRTFGLPGATFGDMTLAALPADNGAFVVTIAVFKDDPLFDQNVGRTDVFEFICQSVPRVSEWVDPARSEPTGPVIGWANMDFLWRTTAAERVGVLDFFFVGDSLLRSNPKYGRGCTCATIASHVLANILASERNPSERAKRYEQEVSLAFRTEWEDLLSVDRSDYERFEIAVGRRKATLRTRLFSTLQDLITKRAMIVDPYVHRTMMKGFFGLSQATAWTKDPKMWFRLALAALPLHDHQLYANCWIRPSRGDVEKRIRNGQIAT